MIYVEGGKKKRKERKQREEKNEVEGGVPKMTKAIHFGGSPLPEGLCMVSIPSSRAAGAGARVTALMALESIFSSFHQMETERR